MLKPVPPSQTTTTSPPPTHPTLVAGSGEKERCTMKLELDGKENGGKMKWIKKMKRRKEEDKRNETNKIGKKIGSGKRKDVGEHMEERWAQMRMKRKKIKIKIDIAFSYAELY